MNDEKWFENDKGLSVHEIVKLESEYRIDSLVCAIEGILSLKNDNRAHINEAELVILAVEAMEREVNNGGFAQFFFNDSCIFTPYLVDSLNKIGSIQAKRLAEQAIFILGVSKITKIKEYFDGIQKALDDDKVLKKLSEIDSRYYEMNEDIAALIFKFIKNNINQFDVV